MTEHIIRFIAILILALLAIWILVQIVPVMRFR